MSTFSIDQPREPKPTYGELLTALNAAHKTIEQLMGDVLEGTGADDLQSAEIIFNRVGVLIARALDH